MVSDFLIEERLAQTLSTVAEIIPESPPSSWAEAKAMRAMGLPGEGKTSVTLKNRRKSGTSAVVDRYRRRTCGRWHRSGGGHRGIQ